MDSLPGEAPGKRLSYPEASLLPYLLHLGSICDLLRPGECTHAVLPNSGAQVFKGLIMSILSPLEGSPRPPRPRELQVGEGLAKRVPTVPAENRKQMEASEGAQVRPANPQNCEPALSLLKVTVSGGGICDTAVDNREL